VATPEGDVDNSQSRSGFGTIGLSWTGAKGIIGNIIWYNVATRTRIAIPIDTGIPATKPVTFKVQSRCRVALSDGFHRQRPAGAIARWLGRKLMRLRFTRLLIVAVLFSVCGALVSQMQRPGASATWLADVIGVAEAAGAGAQAAGGAPAMPRTPDGKPDLSGFWQVMNTANFDIQDHIAREGVPAGQGVVEGNEIPYQPWALAKKQENAATRATADPETKCFMPGVPRVMYMPFPFQILITPGLVTILFEYAHNIRYIYTNGSPHPRGPLDWWMGDSRGRWEGDTLVVDVTYFNDQTWFDRAGNFHSDALHVVERYTPIDGDAINYEATIEDPKVFTRPWKMSMILYRHKEKNFRLLEYACDAFDLEKYYPYPELSGQR